MQKLAVCQRVLFANTKSVGFYKKSINSEIFIWGYVYSPSLQDCSL